MTLKNITAEQTYMLTEKLIWATLVVLPTVAVAKEQTLAETAVIGGAQGLIMGVAGVLYFFVWKPLKKKRDAANQKKTILANELTPLMVAAAEGNDEEVGRLIAEGADVNACGKSGETALMMAAKNDRRATVRLLLQSGADVLAKTSKGNTARDIARQHKRLEVADILAEKMDA
jgi:ankyrin repeat protein